MSFSDHTKKGEKMLKKLLEENVSLSFLMICLLKTALNREMRTTYSVLIRNRTKPGTALIETVLTGDPLYIGRTPVCVFLEA